MNWTDLQKAMYDFINGLTTWTVAWSEESAPAPDEYHLMLRITGVPKVAQDGTTFDTETGVLTITGNREFTLELQAYGAGAFALLTAIDSAVEKPSVLAGLREDGIVYVDSEPVQNLTYLIETRYRERAALDIRFRTAETQTDDVGYFDHVEGEGENTTQSGNTIVVPLEVP